MTPLSQQPLAASTPRLGFSLGGTVPVRTLGQLQNDERRAARAAAEAAANQPAVQGLVAHIRKHWTVAYEGRREVEKRMLSALRALRGEYDPDTLAKLRAQNSSEIYMMLFATKARQAKALLGDVLLGTGDDKPWTLNRTPSPDLPPDIVEQLLQGAMQIVAMAEQSGQPLQVDQVRMLLRDAKERALAEIDKEAQVRCARAERKLADALAEGGFIEALDAFLDDMITFPTAYLKGPVVRRTGQLSWVQGEDGRYAPQVNQALKPHWERVDPLNVYHAPWARSVNDAFMFEHHRLALDALESLIGVEGYNDAAIREVLQSHRSGTLAGWMALDSQRAQAEGRSTTHTGAGELIDALQYWGRVTGSMLVEWGMPADQVPDQAKVYEVEVWLIDNWVIKAMLNPDPLSRRPYYAASFKRIPGSVIGMSMYDTMADCQSMCNSAARALSNNMGIASGPQVWVNIDRMPDGEDITALFPWKITQTTSDPTGSSAAPMGFFQPASNAAELMGVFEKFSQLADEYTGIPRYMTGDGNVGGAGRTASGMSMMVGNAGKTIKNLVSNIDLFVNGPLIERAYEFLMRYDPDEDIKGDLRVVARGALSLITKDSAQVRRNEFMALALSNPVVQQMIGPTGIAALLRATARTLDLDTTSIVPSDSEVRMRMEAAMRAQAGAGGAPQPQQIQGPTASAELTNGAPVVDNFGA